MNRSKLERYLRASGCRLVRHGSSHDLWCGAVDQLTAAIPRHAEINSYTVRTICADLGVARPKEK